MSKKAKKAARAKLGKKRLDAACQLSGIFDILTKDEDHTDNF